MECTVCNLPLTDGDTIYELNKGTWSTDANNETEFIHEETKSLIHEACLPMNMPMVEGDLSDN
jgi:hypothetical protein